MTTTTPMPTAPARTQAVRRPARYTAVSIMAGLIAQVGLLLAYTGFGWDTTAAVLFSLAVSVGPSYWGCRSYVWAGLSRHRLRTESASFVLIALAGSATAAGLTWLAEQAGQAFTDDRGLLGLWVCAGSVAATAVVWVARYLVLDKALFTGRRTLKENTHD